MTNQAFTKIVYSMIFAVFILTQNASSPYAQSSKYIDLKTGKEVEKENLARFSYGLHADGVIMKTKMKFGSTVITTNDEQKFTKTVYYSERVIDTKNYFKSYISKSQKIITDEKVKKNDKSVYRRIVFELKNKESESNYYEILIYEGGKSFVSIRTQTLELALEFEKLLEVKTK